MSLGGIDRLLERSESFVRALDAASLDTDYSAAEGLRAPLITGDRKSVV